MMFSTFLNTSSIDVMIKYITTADTNFKNAILFFFLAFRALSAKANVFMQKTARYVFSYPQEISLNNLIEKNSATINARLSIIRKMISIFFFLSIIQIYLADQRFQGMYIRITGYSSLPIIMA